MTGTVLTIKAPAHVHGKALPALKRDAESIEVRLDARFATAQDVRRFGVAVGDFASCGRRAVATKAVFVKSRHLDDKAYLAILLGVTAVVVEPKVPLAVLAHLFVSTYEEVGRGSSAGLPPGTTELVTVDMAAVGAGQTSDEFATTVCVKDLSGPNDYGLSRQ